MDELIQGAYLCRKARSERGQLLAGTQVLRPERQDFVHLPWLDPIGPEFIYGPKRTDEELGAERRPAHEFCRLTEDEVSVGGGTPRLPREFFLAPRPLLHAFEFRDVHDAVQVADFGMEESKQGGLPAFSEGLADILLKLSNAADGQR